MFYMDDLIPKISRKIADGPADERRISKFDFDYAYEQLIFLRVARNLWIFAAAGEFYRLLYRWKIFTVWWTYRQNSRNNMTKH